MRQQFGQATFRFCTRTLPRDPCVASQIPRRESASPPGTGDVQLEEKRSQKMPTVSVEFLHEIAYGCIRMVGHAHNGRFESSRHTHSWRMRWKPSEKHSAWLTVRRNSEGWDELGDRLEILLGPDYRGRPDLTLFKGKGAQSYFAELPEGSSLPILDKRQEIESFDVDEGMRSIGVTRISRPI